MTLRVTPEEIVARSESPLLAIAPWWKRCQLSHIATITNGGAFKSSLFNSDGKGLPLIRIRDVGKAETRTYYSGDYEDKFIINPGDLLIGMDGDFRISRWQGTQALLNQRVCKLAVIDRSLYNDSFLEYVVQPYLDEVNRSTSAVTVKHLSSRTVAELPIPLPSLAEQERIVAAIEEHFSRIDAAESAAQTALTRLDTLRRAILTAAFSGHLVETISPRRTPDGLPEDWQWVTIGDLGNEVKGQITPQPGVIYDLYSVPAFPTGIPERIDGFDIKSGKREVEPYDVLLCKINPRINRVWMVENYSGQKQISSTEYFVLRLFDTRQAPYIKWYLSSPQFREWMGLSVEGGTGSHTRAKSGPIREQSVPIAPPEDRIQIVSAIEEQFSRIDAAKASLERCLQRCNAMRRSVLAAAFSGQLVEQYPDDKPASVLLERIAAERLKRRTRRKPA